MAESTTKTKAVAEPKRKKAPKNTTRPQKKKAGTMTVFEERFCHAYAFECLRNGSRASREAGYQVARHDVNASNLLRKPHIRARIKALEAEAAEFMLLDKNTIMRELAAVGMADITELLVGGSMKIEEFEDLPREVRAAISSVETFETETGTRVKVKMHDKLRALEQASKILSLYKDNDEKPPATLIIKY